MKAWNDERRADRYKGKRWELLHDRSSYVFGQADDRPFEVAFDSLGRIFPHDLGDGSSPNFHAVLGLVPMGDELTLDFAKALVEAEKIGFGPGVDFLAISFSATDYVGHLYGPSSLEAEDNLLRLDRILAELFRFIDERVGLDRTLIVLSADHGGPEAPEVMQELGLEVGRQEFDWFESQLLVTAMMDNFGRDDLIEGYSHPYLYLDMDVLHEMGLDVAEVERVIATAAMEVPGILYAVTRSNLIEGWIDSGPILSRVRNNFHPQRNGAANQNSSPSPRIRRKSSDLGMLPSWRWRGSWMWSQLKVMSRSRAFVISTEATPRML